ncbi:hypothetical protein PWG71_06520 [Nocardiopsis sp. N85]|uniref:hypothetical protein n=1 Tax=Nocardiopsis sp. N85 TaxID=3029400 RepID=UPI00237F04E1|nr:hypothetical protein [Nocardiopsis sp. N85]MDE3721037.1 hypothetical protein [Nocardiopsis sp. N85]
MNNETLERLRLPAAWVLIGAVGASVLAGLIGLISGSAYPGSFASAMLGASGHFFGLSVVILLAVAVALVLTSERTRSAAFPIVLIALILSGVGLLFALVNLIAGFMLGASAGFGNLLGTLSQGAVLGIFAFALLKVFNDPTLVPRAAPQQPAYGGYPQTGAQQAYAQPGYPAQDPIATGQPAADPAQAVSGQQAQGYDAYGQPVQQYGTGAQQAYGQQAYDASAQQAAYGTDPSAQQAQPQGYDAYGQPVQQYGTGAQQAYGQQAYDASAQQAAYGTDPSAQQAQAQGYDAYGQPVQAQQYGTGAQQGYGQSYDPSQYAPQGGDQQAAPSGEQAAQDAINYGWYQQQGQQAQPPSAGSESGVDPFFNSGENNGTETTDQTGGGYGGQYGSTPGYGSDQQGQGGTGGQQGWYGGEGQR